MKFLVIGLGSIGARHARNLLDMGHEIVGHDPIVDVASIDPRIQESEDNWACDGFIIASPTSTHMHELRNALHWNVPCLVEKPIVGDMGAALLLDTLDLSKVMVGNNLRFHNCVERARSWLPSIGTPIWANFTCAQFNDKPEYLRDGVTLNWGAHEVDLALHLLGPATVIGANIDVEDECSDILLQHVGGCSTTIHLDYLTKPEMRGFAIMGTENHISVRLTDGRARLGTSGTFNFSNIDWNETYIREMEAFIDRIDGKEDKIGASGQDGLDCLKLLLDAKRMAGL